MPVNTHFPPLTVENYKLLPETGPRYQLIQGDLYMAPAPNRFHQERVCLAPADADFHERRRESPSALKI